MTQTERIRLTIIDFVKGGDESDVELLDKVLHEDFCVTNNGYLGTKSVTIIDKQNYLSNIKEGIFGGLPRIMTIENIDEIKQLQALNFQ